MDFMAELLKSLKSDIVIFSAEEWSECDWNNIPQLGDNKDKDPRTSEFSVMINLPDGKSILGMVQITQTFNLGSAWIHIPLTSDHPRYIDLARYNAFQTNCITNPQIFAERILGLPWKIKGYDIMCASVTSLHKEGNTQLCHITVSLPIPQESGRMYRNAEKMQKLAEVFEKSTGGIVLKPVRIE